MDFKMPGMNGVEALKEIKKVNSSIKTIFITGYYDESILNKVPPGDISDVCHKPLNIPHLLDSIKTAAEGL